MVEFFCAWIEPTFSFWERSDGLDHVEVGERGEVGSFWFSLGNECRRGGGHFTRNAKNLAVDGSNIFAERESARAIIAFGVIMILISNNGGPILLKGNGLVELMSGFDVIRKQNLC